MKENLLLSNKGVCGDIFVYKSVHDNKEFISLKTSKGYTHSNVCVSDPKASQPQFSFTVLSKFLKTEKVLILGAGLFTNALQINSLNRNARIFVVDIEGSLYEAAKKYLKIDEYKNIEFEVCDARDYLSKSRELYDYIIVDVFNDNIMPDHCMTVEFFRLISDRLEDDGILVINTNMPLLRFFPKKDKLLNPVYNLHSTIYNAGFRAIYHNDSFNLGVLYVFKKNMDNFFADTLKSVYRQENADINIKAAIGAINLMTYKISEKVKAFQPYTDLQKLEYGKAFYSYIMKHVMDFREDESRGNNAPHDLISGITYKYFIQSIREMKNIKSGFEINSVDYYNKIKKAVMANGDSLSPKDLLSRVCFGLELEDKLVEDSSKIRSWKYIIALNKLKKNDVRGAMHWFEA